MNQYNYAYLDNDGWVRQWSGAPRPETLPDGSQGPYQATPVEGFTLDLLPDGFEARQHLRKVDGTYTDMTPAEPAPSNSCELQQSGEALVWVETLTLDEIKAAKNAEINAARLDANRTSFPYDGKDIACDELSRSDIDAVNGEVTLTGALPTGWPGAWKAVDNTYVTIPNVATWTAFYQAMVSAGTTNFNHAQDLKTQLAAATTPAEISAIVW